MNSRLGVAGLLVFLLAAGVVQASGQSNSGMPASEAGAVDCAALANVPTASLSPEACKSLVESIRISQAAASDPNAQRPGDEAMTCEQIFAEMDLVSRGFEATPEAARTDASLDEYMAMKKRQDTELAVAATAANATIMSAAAVDMASGGLSKGAATQAAGTAITAEGVARAARFEAETKPVVGRMNQAIGANAQYGARQMQLNPRAARLGQLAMQQNCSVPGT